MADISAIKALDGVTYSIKDSEARDHLVPASGTTGQVLTKTANGADWADKYPSGGTAGQVLTKNSNMDGDASWQTPQSGGGSWGSITGTLSDQTDLNNALNAKANASNVATIESSTTASQAYSAGDYLVLNGQLYEVTASVSSGETLVVDTNIEARSVGEELTALNNGLIIQFPSTGWTTMETVNGTTYYTQTVSVTSVSSDHPEVGIVPISGTLPTSAEQSAFNSVKYFTANRANNTLKGYATSAPSDTFAVVVKGVS